MEQQSLGGGDHRPACRAAVARHVAAERRWRRRGLRRPAASPLGRVRSVGGQGTSRKPGDSRLSRASPRSRTFGPDTDSLAMHMRRRLPRGPAVAIAASGLLIAHALVPLSVARGAGRTGARPRSAVTGAGVGCLVAGTAGVALSLAQHVEAAPEGGYEVGTLAPEYLLAP